MNSVHYFSSHTCHKIFVTHTQTDRHFPEIVKSCSGHPKTCKSIENRKSKICTKPIFSSTYIEESKNEICKTYSNEKFDRAHCCCLKLFTLRSWLKKINDKKESIFDFSQEKLGWRDVCYVRRILIGHKLPQNCSKIKKNFWNTNQKIVILFNMKVKLCIVYTLWNIFYYYRVQL